MGGSCGTRDEGTVLAGNRRRHITFVRSRRRWADNIKADLIGIEWWGLD